MGLPRLLYGNYFTNESPDLTVWSFLYCSGFLQGNLVKLRHFIQCSPVRISVFQYYLANWTNGFKIKFQVFFPSQRTFFNKISSKYVIGCLLWRNFKHFQIALFFWYASSNVQNFYHASSLQMLWELSDFLLL